MADPSHPYDTLTPDAVLGALASIGLWGDGRLTALSSYENRVYQIPLDEPVQGLSLIPILRFPRIERGTTW